MMLLKASLIAVLLPLLVSGHKWSSSAKFGKEECKYRDDCAHLYGGIAKDYICDKFCYHYVEYPNKYCSESIDCVPSDGDKTNYLCYNGKCASLAEVPIPMCSTESCTQSTSTYWYDCIDSECAQTSRHRAGHSIVYPATETCTPNTCTNPGDRYWSTCNEGGECVQTSWPTSKPFIEKDGTPLLLNHHRVEAVCTPEKCTPPQSLYLHTCSKDARCAITSDLKDNNIGPRGTVWDAKSICTKEHCKQHFGGSVDYDCTEDGQCLVVGGGNTGYYACDPGWCSQNGNPNFVYTCNKVGECIQTTDDRFTIV